MSAVKETPYTEFRSDGWPLCPNCGDDELWSYMMAAWQGTGERPTVEECIATGMRCYRCNWDSDSPPVHRIEDAQPAPLEPGKQGRSVYTCPRCDHRGVLPQPPEEVAGFTVYCGKCSKLLRMEV